MTLSDRELQDLSNWGNLGEEAAQEIVELRAALAAQPTEPVAEVASKHGDPERFGEREIRALADLRKIPYGTKLYAAQTAPAAVPLTEEQIRDLAKESGLDWHRGYMPLFANDPTNRYEVFARAVLAAAGDKP